MKKVSLMCGLMAMFWLFPQFVSAQDRARIVNLSQAAKIFVGLSQDNLVGIGPRQTASADVRLSGDQASFYLAYEVGSARTEVGWVTQPVKAGKVYLDNVEQLTGSSPPSSSQSSRQTYSSPQVVAPPSGKAVWISLANKSKKFVYVEDGPFAGLGIGPGGETEGKVAINMGPVQFSVIYADSSNQKTMPKAVISRIVVIDDEYIEIDDNDFSERTVSKPADIKNKKTILVIDNQTDYSLVGAEGLVKGVVVRKQSKYRQTLKADQPGFNTYLFEFLDNQGHKRRVTIHSVLTEGIETAVLTSSDVEKNSAVVE